MAFRLSPLPATDPATSNPAYSIGFHVAKPDTPLSRIGSTPRPFGTGAGTGNFFLLSDLSGYPAKELERSSIVVAGCRRIAGWGGVPSSYRLGWSHCQPRVGLNKTTRPPHARDGATPSCNSATRTHEAASLRPDAAAYPRRPSEPSSQPRASARETVGYSNRVSAPASSLFRLQQRPRAHRLHRPRTV